MFRLALPIGFALLCFSAYTYLVVHAQQPPPIEVGKNSDLSFAYDWDGKDIQGNDDMVDAAQFVFREFPPAAPPLPPKRVLRTKAGVVGENKYPVKPILRNIEDGQYTLTVRLRDAGANWSNESVGLVINVTSKKPTRPTSLRVVGR